MIIIMFHIGWSRKTGKEQREDGDRAKVRRESLSVNRRTAEIDSFQTGDGAALQRERLEESSETPEKVNSRQKVEQSRAAA